MVPTLCCWDATVSSKPAELHCCQIAKVSILHTDYAAGMGAEAGLEPASAAYEAVKAPFLYSAICSQKATRVTLFFMYSIMKEFRLL